MKFVQFSDASQIKIIAEFFCPQDADTYPNQGEVEDADPRYLAFVNPPQTAEAIRAERNAKLSACDWTVLVDAPLSSTQASAWKAYRKALRDLTDQPEFPASVSWPEPPK